MAYRLVRSDSFDADYLGVVGYLIDVLSSRSGAQHLVGEVDRVAALLEKNPYMNCVRANLC